ncbi:glycosyltransferase family 2 protein [Phenylobacterium sp. LjRoot225]|uniref:glycosyltransferase n=1 Tax=Phenylobacterium sp. LjRoot225 TaxID=3342285 RepID=UPI003ECF0399
MSDASELKPGDASCAPQVSVLVCTRNRGDKLDGTLRSLNEIQTSIPWEAILLDNGSTDQTREVILAACAENPRFRYAHEGQRGLGAARDTGWRLSRGEIVALSDDDCYLAPDYVDQIWALFAENPDIGVAGGQILLYDPDDAPITLDLREHPVRIEPRTLVRTGSFQGANIAFRRAALEAVDGFDRALGAGTDFPAEDIDAAAAVIWAGYAGLYDPRPKVHHHHRRKQKDITAQIRSYDLGRGAYYAKRVLQPETHDLYMRDWKERFGGFLKPEHPKRLTWEMKSAVRYVFRYGSLTDRLVHGTMFAAVLAVASGWRYFEGLKLRISPAA